MINSRVTTSGRALCAARVLKKWCATATLMGLTTLAGCADSNASRSEAKLADSQLISTPLVLSAENTVMANLPQNLRLSLKHALKHSHKHPFEHIGGEDLQWLSQTSANQHWLVSTELHGLLLVELQNTPEATGQHQAVKQLAQISAGNYGALDAKVIAPLGETVSGDHSRDQPNLLVAASNNTQNTIELYRWANQQLQSLAQIPVEDSVIEALCLFHDAPNQALYAFIAKYQQGVEQRQVYDFSQNKPVNAFIRELPAATGISDCVVDDSAGRIYLAEENTGVWAMDAYPEAVLYRKPVAMLQPFGELTGEIKGLALSQARQLLISQPDESRVALVDLTTANPNAQAKQHRFSWLPFAPDAESIQRLPAGNASLTESLIAWVDGVQHVAAIPPAKNNTAPMPTVKQRARLQFPRVFPLAETQPVARFGDAADDPAIWVHPQDTSKSLILGTDKRAGLGVYNLAGTQVQFLNAGRLNNVDLRSQFNLAGKSVAVAAASQRDRNSIALFTIDKAGLVAAAGDIPTSLNSVYGLCMFHWQQTGQHFVFINDKDGRYQQYQLLSTPSQQISGKLVREFRVQDQPEGCVANEYDNRLFVGVEDHGVWHTSALPDGESASGEPVSGVVSGMLSGSESTETPGLLPVLQVNAHTGGAIADDVEGLAIYADGENSLLVVSSQGNDSYAIYQAKEPFHYLGSVRVAANVAAGIDGASETDGLEVSSVNFSGLNAGNGKAHPLAGGLLVVQDGRNVMPVEPQNFKLVPFSAILNELKINRK